ncbi:MAG TPA: outer membrane lipoprotein-sorting protein, partial [Atribacterota bacterium]|nr:outer membrane lipoprotein-sorting protein [Atribacterota bacterium]
IINGSREMTKTMESVTDGENGLTEFTNPRDRGTKFLKRGDNLFLLFPDAEDIVKMSGHMLQQGMMGSDFSYQDMMESDKLTDLYNFEIIGEEEYQDRLCYKLEGIKREEVETSYYRRVAWVDKERFIGLKEELYAQSGRLLKETFVEELKEIEGRWFPVKSIMENKLKKNTRTIFKINKIEFNPELEDDIFTIENLR